MLILQPKDAFKYVQYHSYCSVSLLDALAHQYVQKPLTQTLQHSVVLHNVHPRMKLCLLMILLVLTIQTSA